MARPLVADRLVPQRFPLGELQVKYLRPGGSLANSGDSPGDAWPGTFAGFSQWLRWLSVASVNLAQQLDITGCNIAHNEVVNLGGDHLGGLNFNIRLPQTANPNNNFSQAHAQVYSDLAPVLAPITVTGSSTDAVTGLRTFNVSTPMVPNAHIGQFVVGSDLAEWGVIQANTNNQLVVTTTTNPATWSTPIGIYEPGATLTFGGTGFLDFNQALYLMPQCDWMFSGVRLRSTDDEKSVALQVLVRGSPQFQLCDIAGISLVGNGGFPIIDASYIHDGIVDFQGAQVTLRQSLLRSVQPMCHGAGGTGLVELIQCILDGLTDPWGSGNVESAFNCFMQNCRVTGALKSGVECNFATTRLQNCRVEDSAGSGILVNKNATVILQGVAGTGNTGWGVRIDPLGGGCVSRSGSVTVTGANGDIEVGSAGTFTWAALPAFDISNACRAL